MSDCQNQSPATSANASANEQPGRVPARRFFGESINLLVSSLHMRFQAEESLGESTLLGFVVPDFQRPDTEWSRAQQISFIEALYEGANIGAFMVNMPARATDETWNILLDGLQRLTALKSYWRNDFAVTGADGWPYLWGDLQTTEQAHLLRMTMPYIATRFSCREDMVRAYNRHNFSGTPHTASQRAMPGRGL